MRNGFDCVITSPVRRESLCEPIPGLKNKYQDQTLAMALGLTGRVMTVGDIL
jgi:hypothetical protein